MNPLGDLVIDDYGMIILFFGANLPWKSFLYTVLPSNGILIAAVLCDGFIDVIAFLPPQFK